LLRTIATALRLFVGLLLFAAMPVWAEVPANPDLKASCHAYASDRGQARSLRESASAAGWICADRDWNARTRHALLRFELGPEGRVPAQLLTRLGRFEALRVEIERSNGRRVDHSFSPADFSPSGHMRMALALPEPEQAARRITLEFVGPTLTTVLTEVRLTSQVQPQIGEEQVWIALLCGFLLVPLFFNLVLYRALHERFLLWHVGVVGFMLVHTLVTSGLTALFGHMPVGTLSLLIPLTFCGGAACAVMMACDFIEPAMLDPIHRRLLHLSALWLMLNGAFYVATIDWLQSPGANVYFLNWIVMIAATTFSLFAGLRRGSRAVKFLLASWLPLILTGLWQVFESLTGNETEPMLVFVAQRLAIGFEVLISSIGIADRVIQLRRDRDDERDRAGQMARLAERDPLTGLLNRRSIEARFAELRDKGFATLALLDLDHFKAINDRSGHEVGDRVLQAVASALPEDRNALALRMGGEEFMLLLRGRNAAQRAEHIRQAIPARVAREFEALAAPVTASMGLVEIPPEVMPEAKFAAIYARADRLLYQAKATGRNRTVSERLTVFAAPRRQARKARVA
jgi:diguanylate cyclase (GGDEF)-like protein